MWIYLKCSDHLTFSAESEESQQLLKTTCDPSHTAKSNPIVKQCSSAEWPLEIWDKLQYGMIFGLSTVVFSKEQLTLFSAASHVRILALQDMEKAWQESEADYFLRSCAWPKKLSPRSYSLKTSLQSHTEGDFKSLEKLPRWGTIVDGVLYPLQALEPSIKEIVGSCWHTIERRLPTPKACDALKGESPCERRRDNPNLAARLNMHMETTNKKVHPRFIEWMMMYPTGWTELKPLETQLCPLKVEKLFKSCRALNKKLTDLL